MNTVSNNLIEDGTLVVYRRPGTEEFSGTLIGKAGTHRDLYLVRKWDNSVVACDVDYLWEELDALDQRESFGTCY